MENNDLLRRAEDLRDRCERRGTLTHTGFLTPAERYRLENWAKHSGVRLLFSGGGPDCERRCGFFLPDYLTGEERSQEVLRSKPNVRVITGTKATGFETKDGELTGIRLRRTADGAERLEPCDGVFVAVGLIPENEAFADAAGLNDYGYIDSDERCLTASPGLFAAGDCRAKELRQLTTAAGDGAVAAVAACRYVDAL